MSASRFRPAFTEGAGRSFMESPGRARLLDPCILYPGEVPIGRLTLDDVTQSLPFAQAFDCGASVDAGQYVVRYCRGAWLDSGTGVYSVTSTPSGGHSPDQKIWITHSGGSTADFNEPYPTANFYSILAAETACQALTDGAGHRVGCFTRFQHSGGDILLNFYDTPATGNANTPSMPEFILCELRPVLRLDAACCDLLSAPNHFRTVFTFFNTNRVGWGTELSCSVRGSGGISNVVSEPTFSIGALDTTDVTVDFDITSGDTSATATIDIKLYGNVVQTLTVDLAAAPATGIGSYLQSGAMCTVACHHAYLMMRNAGTMTTLALAGDIAASWSGGPIPIRRSSDCAVVTSLNIGQLSPCGGQLGVHLYLPTSGGPSVGDLVSITFSPADGTTTYPTVEWQLNVT